MTAAAALTSLVLRIVVDMLGNLLTAEVSVVYLLSRRVLVVYEGRHI
jgi:hypothetical protein